MKFYKVPDGFLRDDDKLDRKIKYDFKSTFLSLNVPINQPTLIELFKTTQKEAAVIKERGEGRAWTYPPESLHFSLAGILVKEDDLNSWQIKDVVEKKMGKVKDIVKKEINKIEPFFIQPRFMRSTADSIFIYCSFPLTDKIRNLQETLVKNIGELFNSLEVCAYYSKNKKEGAPINIARWLFSTRGEVDDLLEGISEKPFKEINLDYKNLKVEEVALTYSDQFWSNPGENIIKKFTLSK